jgi:hypothetical protein
MEAVHEIHDITSVTISCRFFIYRVRIATYVAYAEIPRSRRRLQKMRSIEIGESAVISGAA